jgi:DNA mismatch endonuclease, patch repair protein
VHKPQSPVRYLLNVSAYTGTNLPGNPDLAFPARRKVIFVHGCFWHSHACKAGLIPKSNLDFWLLKLWHNKARDRKNLEALKQLGWNALVIWQCELKQTSAVRLRVKRFLGQKGCVQSSTRGA